MSGINSVSCCRNHLCWFGSVDKLQLEEVPAWLRQCNLLQSYQEVTAELCISIDLEEGLLKDDHKFNPTKKKRQNNFFGMWKSISGLSPLPSVSSIGVGLLLPLLLIVSDCTEAMLQKPLKSTENFSGTPNYKFMRFSQFKTIHCLAPVCQDRSRILVFQNITINFNMKLGTDFKRIIPVIYVLAILAYSTVLTYVKFYADSLHILILNKYVHLCTL